MVPRVGAGGERSPVSRLMPCPGFIPSIKTIFCILVVPVRSAEITLDQASFGRKPRTRDMFVSPLPRLTPLEMSGQYFVSWFPIPLNYLLPAVFRLRDRIPELSSFALMEMFVFNSREMVQLVFARTVILMKSLCLIRGAPARTSS